MAFYIFRRISQLLTHPPFAAPAGLLKAGVLGRMRREQSGKRDEQVKKNGPLGIIHFIPGPELNVGYPFGPDAIPYTSRPRTLGYVRPGYPGPEVNAGPGLPRGLGL